MTESPADNSPWLDRRAAAAYLTGMGRPIAAKTLANWACNNNAGGGPAFVRSGWRTVRYQQCALDKWVRRKVVKVE